MFLRPVESYSEIYNKYWEYGFWYEKIGAIILWIINTIILTGCGLLLFILITKFFF